MDFFRMYKFTCCLKSGTRNEYRLKITKMFDFNMNEVADEDRILTDNSLGIIEGAFTLHNLSLLKNDT